ncbi:MAG: response regulator [Coxiellaceae bacterium]|nr:response regulator [Coxiellaceae bacterium]
MTIDPKILKQLLEIFQVELKEHYQTIVDGLLLLETDLNDATLTETLQNVFRAAHNIKGAAKSVGLNDVATIAHQIEDQFSVWRDDKKQPTQSELDEILKQADSMLAAAKGNKTETVLKIPSSRVDKANAKVDEALILRLKLERLAAELEKSQKNSSTNADTLQHFIGQCRSQLLSIDKEMERALKTLQSDLRDMRLLPISTLLNPLKRTAHDLAQSMNKVVDLSIVGGDIELDKSVLDLLRDPLQHLLRNAVDHGIEKEGKININVANESGKIKMTFADNGRGINIGALKQKAISNGVIEASAAEQLKQDELLDLIFSPGLSTHDQVTDISGRGVGMDVVRKNIESAKGTIDVESSEHGTKFILSLPLTLAVEQGLFLAVGNQEFVLPSTSSSNIVEIKPHEITAVENDQVYILDKEPIPVRNLKSILKIESLSEKIDSRPAILLSRDQKKVFILADKILNESNYVVKPLPYPMKTMQNIAGSTLTTEGELILVLDPISLLDSATKIAANADFSKMETKEVVEKKRVLIVDDSLTTRNLIVNALTAAGYFTKGVKDGEEAILTLADQRFDIVVTDIEMPNINGYELTKQIKSSEQLKQIPVIIVTSHDSENEKNEAARSGANEFLVKSEFNTEALITAIERLV